MLWVASLIGRMLAFLTRHLGGGHGSALPGLVVERLYPKFLSRVLAQLPNGVVLISGTNGKTTTTKIVVDLLRADGYRVFTNPSGSNYTRGVVSAAVTQMKRGKLSADIAVLELDEAYATQFVDQVRPDYCLLLNVLRDQLDRFGEIDNTAKLLGYVAKKTRRSVVANEDDPRLRKVADSLGGDRRPRVAWFGYCDQASELYRNDEELHGRQKKFAKVAKPAGRSVRLSQLTGNVATYHLGGQSYQVKLRLFGIHNALNCAAALGIVREIEGDKFDAEQAVAHLGAIKPAFGRGEEIVVDGALVRLVLVKNPSGFQLGLDSSSALPTLIAINDQYADGRDVSWLWDVSFDRLAKSTVVATTGIRGYDMSVRLLYDGVAVAWTEADLSLAVRRFVRELHGTDGQIFATYTAMLRIRDELQSIAGSGIK